METKICAMMKTTGDLSCSNYKGFTSYLSGGKFLNFLNIDECEDKKLRIAKISASEYNSRKYAIEKIINLSRYDNRNNTIIKHYKKMGYVPFWVLIHGLTLNELSQLFLMLKYEDKKDFVEELTNKQKIIYRDVKSFSSKLADITTIRNIVNHYEPIIPYILSYDYDKIQILYNSISLLWSNYLKHVDSLLTISVDLDVIAQKENTYNKYKIVRIINILKILK